MKADFNRLDNCCNMLRSAAIKVRNEISAAESLIPQISQQSGTYAITDLIKKAVDEMESESFLMLEMSNVLGDACRSYQKTENEISDLRTESILRTINIDKMFVYTKSDNNSYFTDYFQL